ncbi:MAG TPA: serine hydrolase domain-containing protein, partial [Flavisolibacter sp.]|nr:serine hydrolase domain-containing protein [Flavisolibacter sp.]
DLIKKGLSFSTPTGTAYEYSNLGYAMLGYIIKRVTGKPYEQYINETIIRPLGMTSTYWEFSKIPKRQLAHGYRWINNNWQEEALLSHGAYGAMGGLITSLEDFIKYMNLHMNAWPPRHDTEATVAKRSSLREMHKPWNFSTLNAQYKYPGGRPCAVASAYGYGLRWTSDCEGRTTVGHSGGLPGFGSNWTFLPEYGIGVICFANVTYAPTSIINTKVLDTILAISKIKPRQLIPSRILLQRQQELMEILPGWNTKGKNIFAENFFLDYSINALRSEANELFTKAGQIKQVKEIVPTNNLRGAFIIEGEHSNIEVRFTLTPEQVPLIQEYRIREIPK